MSLLDDAQSAGANFGLNLPDPSSLLGAFAGAFTQDSRSLELCFSADSGLPANTLLPHRLTGHEGINQSLYYELEALASDPGLELKSFIGVAVQVSILTDNGEPRTISGLVTGANQEGADGDFARYRLVIEDGLSVLRLARHARVAVDTNVLDLTQKILAAHLAANPVLAAAFQVDNRCRGTYPQRPFWMQGDESDLDYLRRLWAREGISYVVASAEDSSADQPLHSLILFDDPHDLDANPAGSVRFHGASSTETSDSVTQWNGRQTLQSGAVARSAWDPSTASVNLAEETSQADQGDHGNALAATLEDYRHEAPLDGDDPDGFAARTTLRMQARDGWTSRFDGTGTVRAFSAGSWFTLTGHPIHDRGLAPDRDFVLVSLDVTALNNLPKPLQDGLGRLAPSQPESPNAGPDPVFRADFICVRRGTPILADEIQPPDPGLLTATVAGPAGEVVHTDELGRIKVTFHLARDEDHPDAGASGTDADSAWIRQQEILGSRGFGGGFVPRVGDEVLVEFLSGDPDKPLITGSAPNGARSPASFAAASSLPYDRKDKQDNPQYQESLDAVIARYAAPDPGAGDAGPGAT